MTGKTYMTMCFLIVSAASATFSHGDNPRGNVLDFSRSHSAEQLLQSKVDYEADTSKLGVRRTFDLAPQSVVLRLPGGRELSQRIEWGSINSQDHALSSFSFAGPVLPLDEAIAVARNFHFAFRIPTERLEAWKRTALEKGVDAAVFTTNVPNHFPAVGIEIRQSANPLYPWFVTFGGGWIAPRHAGWDEERAERENPAPPNGMEQVSLDAPSGRIYKSEDAYVGLVQQQRELDKRLGQVRDENGQLISPDRKKTQTDSPKPSAPSQPQATAAATKGGNLPPRAQTSMWVAIAAFLGAVAGWLVFRSKRKKKPRAH
jgi:hypothetical protein